MGEIMLLGLRSTAVPKTPDEKAAKAMELRTLAEFTLRNRLLAVTAPVAPYPGRRPCETRWLVTWTSAAVACVSLATAMVIIG